MAQQWTDDSNAAILTDLYQLTMLQAYFKAGMNEEAVFDLFVRRLRSRNFLLSAGLDTVLHFLETVRFTDEVIDYLDSLGLFDDDFLHHLKDFRFTGSVYAIAEGTPFFANESVLQVKAPIQQAQLVETFVLNQITFQTNIASKAARVVAAADGIPISDFGARRMHGADAAIKAVRAYHIAGIDSTSNVLAGKVYGVKVTGTMAHSYIESFDSEREAFATFAQLYPETTLLVDTYDTLAAVRMVADMAAEMGDSFIAGIDSTSNVLAGKVYGVKVTGTMAHSYIESFDSEREAFATFAQLYPETTLLVDTYDTLAAVRMVADMAAEMGDSFNAGAIRLDSGDLAQLSRDARLILDNHGLQDVRIFVSGSLDEYAVKKLVDAGAPIDGFGVGTSMGTIADQPFLDSVYKLSSYDGRPRMKLSASKTNLPGLKQVFRKFDAQGKVAHDTITGFDETVDGVPLVKCVMKDGVRTKHGKASLEDARRHAQESISTLPDELLSLEKIEPEYEVRISDNLRRTRDELQEQLAAMSGK